MSRNDYFFMKIALTLARKAMRLGETPVGAVLVHRGRIIGSGCNRVERDPDPTAHAEIVCIRKAAGFLGDWRLINTTLYVTLEPCMMCAAALLNARVEKVVFGAWDTRYGAFGSLFDLAHDFRCNREIDTESGIMAEQSAELLQQFFRRQRIKNDKAH
ncbi:MAG: tRNA adenosine(34) deaminase TadA [Pseudomonadota bacterium]